MAEWNYKGHKIELETNSGKFNCQSLSIFNKDSLDKVKSAIDEHIKKGITPIKALYRRGNWSAPHFDEVDVLGIAKVGFWIKDRYGDKRMENHLVAINKENKQTIEQIENLRKSVEETEEKIRKLVDGLIRVKTEDLMKAK